VVLLAPHEFAPAARARGHETNHRRALSRQPAWLLLHLAGPHHGLCAAAAAKRSVTGLAQVEAGPGGAAAVAVQFVKQGHRGVAVVFLHGGHEQSDFAPEETAHVENTHQVSHKIIFSLPRFISNWNVQNWV